MKPAFVVTIAIWSGGTIAAAGPAEDAIVAAMKLSEQSSYSWTTVVHDEADSYEIRGKTAGGFTWLRQPMIRALARRLGRDADPDIEAFFRNGTAVIRTPDGWLTLDELPRYRWDWHDEGAPRQVYAGSVAVLDPHGLPLVLGTPALVRRADPEIRRYSTEQFGVSHPHEELGIIVCSHKTWDIGDRRVSGRLNNFGAQLLLVRDGQGDIEPIEAAGVFELELAEGIVTRYTLILEGWLKVKGKKVCVRQTSRTIINEVGATSFEVPAEALWKLTQ